MSRRESLTNESDSVSLTFVPEKRTESLPKDWENCNLELLIEMLGGFAFKSKEYAEEGIPILRMGNIIRNYTVDLNKKSTKYIPQSRKEEFERYLLNENDLVMTLTDLSKSGKFLGTIGKVPMGQTALLNQRVAKVTPYSELAKDFMYYALQQPRFRLYMSKDDTGTIQQNTNHDYVGNFVFSLPPKNEQARIVTAIESLQQRSARARALLEEVRPALGNLRQSILQAAFSGRLTADWRAKNPGVEPADQLLARIRTERRERWEAEQLEKFEAKGKKPPKNWKDKYKEPEPVDESGLPELPVGWCWVRLHELPNDEPHSLCIGPFGSNLKVKDYRESGVPLVFVREIRAEQFGDKDTKYVTSKKARELSAHTVFGGDLLITKMGDPPGDTAIYPSDSPKAIITADCIKLSPKIELTFSEFLRYWLSAGPMQIRILEETQGVAQRKLSLKRFRNIIVPLPSISEQQELVRILDEANSPCCELSESVDFIEKSLMDLNQSILSKAFRGELVPQDPNDEPAADLLDRIRATREAANTKKKTTRKKKTKKKSTRK